MRLLGVLKKRTCKCAGGEDVRSLEDCELELLFGGGPQISSARSSTHARTLGARLSARDLLANLHDSIIGASHLLPVRVVANTTYAQDYNMQFFSVLLTLLGVFSWTASAQFGFFDQMFGGQQQQHQQQQQQNVRSDSSWYQAQYENGTFLSCILTSSFALPIHLSTILHKEGLLKDW